MCTCAIRYNDTTTVQTTWPGCDGDVKVTLLTIIGVAIRGKADRQHCRRTSLDIWNFLSRYSLQNPQG